MNGILLTVTGVSKNFCEHAGVPRRSTTATSSQWAVLADLAQKRRDALGLKAGDLEAFGISRSTVSSIENNKQTSYETQKLINLCQGLRWTADSVDRILAGEKPIELDDVPSEDITEFREQLDGLASTVERIAKAVQRLEEFVSQSEPMPKPTRRRGK